MDSLNSEEDNSEVFGDETSKQEGDKAQASDVNDMNTDTSPSGASKPEYLEKVQPSLLEKVGDKGYAKVFVATTNVADVAKAIEGYDYKGLIGPNAVKSDEIVVPLLEVPTEAIPDIAALPDVITIFEYSPPVRHDYEAEEGFGLDIQPMNLNSTVHHRANKAWENNFTGDGIKVAVIDDGVDFAHPDLMGTQARVDQIHDVKGAVVVASAFAGETTANMNVPYYPYIVNNSYILYKNSVAMMPTQYTLDIYTGNVTFTPALSAGDIITADYSYYSAYYNLPIAFDPFSMGTYLSTRDATDTWYTATNTTDKNVTHTIRMDGINDFWRDGSELIAADRRGEVLSLLPLDYGNDYDLVGLYVTQDKKHWYIGIESFANQTNMTFGVYINTTIGGATNDPLGNYVNAKYEHRPEFAIYIIHNGLQENWNENDTLENATIFKWDEINKEWDDGIDLIDSLVGGEQAYSGWKPKKLEGLIELKIPKSYLNDDGNITLMAFTTGIGPSQPQDTVDTDLFPYVKMGTPGSNNTAQNPADAFESDVLYATLDSISSLLELQGGDSCGNNMGSITNVYLEVELSQSGTFTDDYVQVHWFDSTTNGTWHALTSQIDERRERFDVKPEQIWTWSDFAANDLGIRVNYTTVGADDGVSVNIDQIDFYIEYIPAVYLPDLVCDKIKTLTSFTIAGNGFWNHTYRPTAPISGRLSINNMSWPTEYILTNTSKSGVYNFGDLPDENYPQTRVLVVDEAIPSVYDTVYVDLDHNKDFRNDKPNKRLGKYDALGFWHDVNWSGAGTMRDEVVYADHYDASFGVTSIDYSPNSSYLATGSNDHKIILWRTSDNSIYKALDAHFGRVTGVEFSPDGKYIAASYDDASGGGQHNVAVWNFTTGEIDKTLIEPGDRASHDDKVTAVAWSPSGNEIASSSLDGTVKIWNFTTGQLMGSNNTGEPAVSVDWSSKAQIAVGASKTIKIWNYSSAIPMEFNLPEKVASLAFNPNGSWLAVGGYNYTVRIYNVSSGAYGQQGLQHAGINPTIMSVSWSSDGTWLMSTATSSAYNSIIIWSVLNYDSFFTGAGKMKETNFAHVYDDIPRDVISGAFSPVGWDVATGGYEDIYVRIWDYQGILGTPTLLLGHTEGSTDETRYDAGDSLPDISGGMIYYIATMGVPLPYSESYVKRLAGVENNVIPKNGQMVAFMGAMDKEQTHGTLVASAIVGQGKSLNYDENTDTYINVPNVFGFSPNTKLIAIANIYMSNIFDGWYFAVEGYDGEVGTGDEALIASNSYGFSTIYPDGWHFYDRFVDWISILYSKGRTAFVFSAGNEGYGYGTVASPAASTGVITVGASTDFGYRPQAGWESGPNPTYGDLTTFSSRGPTAMGKPDPDLVANGRMSFGSWALNQVTYAPNYDGSRASDLWSGTSLSAPTASGILALVYEAYYKAEHSAINETISDFISKGNYNETKLWHSPIRDSTYIIYKNGIELPQANYTLYTENGTLLIYDKLSLGDNFTATYRFYNDYPDALTARNIMMSSSDNINFDVLSQGSGFANAERATNIANNINGIMVSPNQWTPGDFKGKKYDSSISFMKPGTYENATFHVQNANPTSGATINITDGVFKKIDELNYTVKTNKTKAHWSIVYVTNYLKHNLTSPGINNMSNKEEYKLADINETIWFNTELLKVSAIPQLIAVDPNIDGTMDSQYWLDIYDWTCEEPCDDPAHYDPDWPSTADQFTGAYLNRINLDHPDGNALEIRIHNPAQRIHDALGISLRPMLGDVDNIEFRITLEFYNKTDWNWLEVDNQLTLGSGNSTDGIKTFNANLSVPSDAPLGSYEGAIYIDGTEAHSNETTWGRDFYPYEYIRLGHDNVLNVSGFRPKVYRNGTTLLVEGSDYWLHPNVGVVKLAQNITSVTNITVDYWYWNVTTIPILVNIPAETVDFSFGDSADGQDELFMNQIIGGFGNGRKSGDWRYYYVDLPDQGLFASGVTHFHLNITWENNLTDVDAFSFGKGGSNPAGVQYPEERYGPVLFLENKGGSEETGAVYTTTNSNGEIVLSPLTGGLNIIAVHNVKLNGSTSKESLHGEVGLMHVTPSELKISTNKLSGSRNVTLYSSRELKGVGGVAAGPSAPERIVNITIKQDDISGLSTQEDFYKALANGYYTKFVTVQKSALIFGANITSLKKYVDKPCKDLDLGVFLDGKGADNVPDGEAKVEELVSYDADQDAEERVKIIRPKVEDDPDTPGINEAEEGAPYIIKVLGYDTGGQCMFNMDVTLVQGEGFVVEGASEELIQPFTVSNIGVSWNLPQDTKDGELQGAFYVGPYNAPMALLIPIEMVVERASEGPGMTGPSAAPQIYNFEIITFEEVDYTDNRTTNDNRPTIMVSLSDNNGELDWQSVGAYLNGTDVTSAADIDIPFEDPDGRDGPLKNGYWNGFITYTPSKQLPDGTYTMKYVVKDLAGNTPEGGFAEFYFVIDTTPPSLDIPDGFSTTQSSMAISGQTDQFAKVTIRGTNITADIDGFFSATIELVPGINDISVTTVDWYAMDIGGNLEPANSNSETIRIINDVLAPRIFSVSNSTGTPTNEDITLVKGFVEDSIGNLTSQYSWDPMSVEVKVNGIRINVLPGGFFSVLIPLSEGVNTVTLAAMDEAGNAFSTYLNITKDVTPPALSLEAMPSEVSTNSIEVRGNAEAGSTVLVNGQYVTSKGGDFSFNVTLSRGLNTITIEAVDEAGNVEKKTVSITYSLPTQLSYYTIPLFIVIFIIVFLIGLQISSKKPPEKEEQIVEVEEKEEHEVKEEKM